MQLHFPRVFSKTMDGDGISRNFPEVPDNKDDGNTRGTKISVQVRRKRNFAARIRH